MRSRGTPVCGSMPAFWNRRCCLINRACPRAFWPTNQGTVRLRRNRPCDVPHQSQCDASASIDEPHPIRPGPCPSNRWWQYCWLQCQSPRTTIPPHELPRKSRGEHSASGEWPGRVANGRVVGLCIGMPTKTRATRKRGKSHGESARRESERDADEHAEGHETERRDEKEARHDGSHEAHATVERDTT